LVRPPPATAAAVLEVAEWSVFDQVIERGDVGFAEAWIDGDWHSPDLTALLTCWPKSPGAVARCLWRIGGGC
jgi:cyclopropane-fatty-acyl-phospholipid synthase